MILFVSRDRERRMVFSASRYYATERLVSTGWWGVCLALGGEGVVEMLGREDRERVGKGSGR